MKTILEKAVERGGGPAPTLEEMIAEHITDEQDL